MARPLSRALAEHLVEWQREPWPVRWHEVFGRRAPLVLEIGFGNGEFLAEQAAARPERDHVGMELSWTAATHAFRRLDRVRAANARVVLGDAEALVERLFAPESLDEVVANHPCPWPKARHHERRLFARGFLALLAERMKPRAPLTIVTDHAEYAQWLAAELEAAPALESRHATSSIPAIAGRTPTKYQLRAMAEGLPIHYFEWRKRAAPSADAHVAPTPAPAAPNEMPTVTLSGEVAPAELFRGFRPLRFRELADEVEVVVKLNGAYARVAEAGAPSWLVEAFVQEGALCQQFVIHAAARRGGVRLKPSMFGEPHPTHGVKRAVWCVAAWLRSAHPALAVASASLGIGEPAEPWPQARDEAPAVPDGEPDDGA